MVLLEGVGSERMSFFLNMKNKIEEYNMRANQQLPLKKTKVSVQNFQIIGYSVSISGKVSNLHKMHKPL